jgi:predicted dehydrogenase
MLRCRQPIRLGVLGCGWIAGNRLRQIAGSGLTQVVAVADPSPMACEAVRHRTGAVPRVHADLDGLLSERLDAVMISTPTGLHAEQALAVVGAGLPVFVQKPLGVTAPDVSRVLTAGARADVPVETDFCYRWLASARALRRELLGNVIGRPYHVEARFLNAYRPDGRWSADHRLAGGGALMDLGIHLLDLVSWVSDRGAVLRDVALRHRGRALAPGEVEDFARLDLVLEGDVPVRVVSAWDASTGRDAEIRLVVYGENGTLAISNHAGSFFDFDACRHFGTWTDALAADRSDAWQAGPLTAWLARVADGEGYQEPAGVRAVAALVDDAYARGRSPEAVAGGSARAAAGEHRG